MTGIYKITNPIGEIYIGQSANIKQRWSAIGKKGSCGWMLMESINKYGHESHKFEVIHELPNDVSKNIRLRYEKLYLSLYQSCLVETLNIHISGKRCKNFGVKKPEGYGIMLSSKLSGLKRTEISKHRISEAGKNRSDVHGESNNNSKLSLSQVNEIRNKYIFRVYTQKMLSVEYGVSLITIERIIRKISWK